MSLRRIDLLPENAPTTSLFGRLKQAFIRLTPRAAGAVLGISLTGVITSLLVPHAPYLPYIVAPMGASSVLLFAVPSSPLAQPWSVVGGNILSALVGAAVGRWIHDPALAAGLAVTLAIGAMSLAGCLHPPGAAVALTAILGGPEPACAEAREALALIGIDVVRQLDAPPRGLLGRIFG